MNCPESVAVIIPVYRAAFLTDALQSVFNQTRVPDEVIVIDDGSPDHQLLNAALRAYGSRLKLIRQSNAGAAAARNAGLRATAADFVAFLDADDRWLPDFLERQLALLASNPNLDLVYADATVIGDTPDVGTTFMTMCPSRGEVTLRSLLAQECNILTSTVVVRRRVVAAAGYFDVALRRGQDFDLWLRLVSRGARVDYRDAVLAVRRLHGHNLSGTRLNELERALHVFSKAIAVLPLTTDERATASDRVRALEGELAREHGKARLASGDFSGAMRFLEQASNVLPSWKLKLARLALKVAPQLLRRVYLARTAAALVTVLAVAS
jgi:glycosyltransferase involved in cell wall biosynthesis